MFHVEKVSFLQWDLTSVTLAQKRKAVPTWAEDTTPVAADIATTDFFYFTKITGQTAFWITSIATLPMRNLLGLFLALVPITMRPTL